MALTSRARNVLQWLIQRVARPRGGANPIKVSLSSERSLQLDCVKAELLVIADQNAAVNTFPGLVHTARHTTKVGNTRSRWPNHLEGAVEGGIRDWGEVVSQLRPLLVTAGDKLGYVLETPQVSRATSRASDGDNAAGEADNQQGSRMPELSS